MPKHPDLTAYVLGELKGAEVELHLASCKRCQEELVRIRQVVSSLKDPPLQTPSGQVWDRATAPHLRRPGRGWLVAFPVAALILLGFLVFRPQPRVGESLVVEALTGAPTIDGSSIAGKGKLGTGEALVTSTNASAVVTLPRVGKVELLPDSQLRLVRSDAKNRRFALDRGTLRATVTAPPRLFVVDTPSASAVDLGCAYELTVDGSGGSMLRVTQGWVVLESKFGASYVRSGMVCESDAKGNLGIPYRASAPQPFKELLRGFEKGTEGVLPSLLAEAQTKDALSLWHLIGRTAGAARAAVYDRLAALAPPPAGVTRDGILRLDVAMIDSWREDFAPVDDMDFWR